MPVCFPHQQNRVNLSNFCTFRMRKAPSRNARPRFDLNASTPSTTSWESLKASLQPSPSPHEPEQNRHPEPEEGAHAEPPKHEDRARFEPQQNAESKPEERARFEPEQNTQPKPEQKKRFTPDTHLYLPRELERVCLKVSKFGTMVSPVKKTLVIEKTDEYYVDATAPVPPPGFMPPPYPYPVQYPPPAGMEHAGAIPIPWFSQVPWPRWYCRGPGPYPM